MGITLVEFDCPECGGVGRQQPCVLRRPGVHCCSRACATSMRNRTRTGPRRHLQDRINVDCSWCGVAFETYRAWVKRTADPCCSRSCAGQVRGERARGERSAVWSGGTSVNASGYRRTHGSGRSGKQRLVHRQVVEKRIGRPLKDSEVVHHRNGDRLDNRIDNLQVMTYEEHGAHHAGLLLACVFACGRRTMPRAGVHFKACARCRRLARHRGDPLTTARH